MDNLAPAQLSANEIPDGFTSASAQQGPAGGGGNNNAAAMKRLQMDEQRKAILEQALSQEALARLGRIKLVKPEKAKQVEQQIVSQAMQGKLPGKVSESKLIELLERSEKDDGSSEKRVNIQRKKYAFDDDSDDDNDDDLL